MAYTGESELNVSALDEVTAAQSISSVMQFQFAYNLIPELVSVSTAHSGTVISSPPFAVVSTGSSASSSASFQNDISSQYRAAEGLVALFSSLFTNPASGSVQYIGLGNGKNGFFFGYDNQTFGILYRQEVFGASATQVSVLDTWIPQANWTQDAFDGTGPSRILLDPTKGNIYKIQMQGLGFGGTNFFIGNPETGNFTLAHQLFTANVNTNASLANFSLPLSAFAGNSSNTQSISMKVSSMGVYTEGQIYKNDIVYSIAGSSSLNVTGVSSLLSITNVSTFCSLLNTKSVVLSSICLRVDRVLPLISAPCVFSLVLNPTNIFSFIDIDLGLSCVQVDLTTSILLTGGRTLVNYYISDRGVENIDLTPYNIYLNPGDILSVGVNGLININLRNYFANLTWVERY